MLPNFHYVAKLIEFKKKTVFFFNQVGSKQIFNESANALSNCRKKLLISTVSIHSCQMAALNELTI